VGTLRFAHLRFWRRHPWMSAQPQTSFREMLVRHHGLEG
jgi:hypothetical protein